MINADPGKVYPIANDPKNGTRKTPSANLVTKSPVWRIGRR